MSGAQGQGIRTAYGVIPNYLDGEGAEKRDSNPPDPSEKETVSSAQDEVKKEAIIKLEMEETVSSSLNTVLN